MIFENNFQASEAIKEALKVNEVKLESPQNLDRQGRSLQGRIQVEPEVAYQQELLDRIAPQEFENSSQAGENLKTAANDIKEPIKEDFEHRWKDLNDQIREMPVEPQPELVQELENFVKDNQGSLLLGESAPEARVLRAAENLLEELSHEGGLIGVSLENLIKTRRTLGDIANWEFGGSNYES
jgi:hypothetical protein